MISRARMGSHLISDAIRVLFVLMLLVGLGLVALGVRSYQNLSSQAKNLDVALSNTKESSQALSSSLSAQLASQSAQIEALLTDDQRVKNQALQKDLSETKKIYADLVKVYESMIDLREGKGKGLPMDKTFSSILSDLSSVRYASASGKMVTLQKDIAAEAAKAALAGVPANVPVSNTAPGSGYNRQSVQTSIGTFVVDIVAADLSSTKVIVDTASDSTCTNNCPVLPLGSYVARSGAYAGVNGSYFCPESYPSCAGKTNSFDLLVMNKSKTYFNSDNNVYSQNPAAIFSNGSARFVAHAQDWGRDTGVDSVISNFPLLLINGQNQFGGNSDPKMGSKGSRSFVGAKGSKAYIGVVRNVTVAEMATVLQTLGLDHAINLDSGGSTALWANGGYKAGPGRSLPNVILFVRR